MSTKKKIKKPTKKPAKKGTSYPAVDKLYKFEAAWAAKQSELVAKHNELAGSIASMEAMLKQLVTATATEIGKMQATLDNHMQALSGLDLNILASAEVLKELTGQITVVNDIIQKNGPVSFSVEEVADSKKRAEEFFKQMVSSAFVLVKARLENDAREFRENQLRAKEEAEKAAKEASEAQAMEQELKDADNVDRTVVSSTSGGPGSSFPPGAEIFGG